jgi:hypothetical protein
MTRRFDAPRAGERMRAAAGLALAALLLGACGGRVKPYAGADLAARSRSGERVKLAILPFENLSKATGAGKTLEGMILVEILKRAPLSVLDPGEIAAALSKERVRVPTSMSRETLEAVAGTLHADLVLVGTVHEYDMQSGTGPGGPIPVLAVTLRVLDPHGGDIVWAASTARRGTDKESVFGIGRIHSLNDLAEDTAAAMASAFAVSLGQGR